jgi:hypothetical protein
MGLLNKVLGNAREIDADKLESEFSNILIEGEEITQAFKIIRDTFVFTNRRLVLVDKQGITGKKTEYLSIPYREISRFSVETAGTFDMDSELKIYISGNDSPTVKKEFSKGTDIKAIQKTLASYILNSDKR